MQRLPAVIARHLGRLAAFAEGEPHQPLGPDFGAHRGEQRGDLGRIKAKPQAAIKRPGCGFASGIGQQASQIIRARETGECLTVPEVQLAVHAVKVVGSQVSVRLRR